MANVIWEKLNNIPESSAYIEFPIAFTGKTKDGKATAFAGLLMSAQYILAEIHTMNKVYKEPAKLTYEHLIQKFGMSRETISVAFKTLLKLEIIECVKQSRYIIKVVYNKKDYLEIDAYWLKHEWEVLGKKKRFARSRFLTLALLRRGVINPKTDGTFVSSQGRIGKALNLPKSTAGDSVRELLDAGLVKSEKADGKDNRKRGCSLFMVNPQIIEVRHPNINVAGVKALFGVSEPTADEMHARLMLDLEYRNLIDRININHAATIKEITEGRGEDTPKLISLESEKVQLRGELESYFKVHRIKRGAFPPGFFRTDITDNETI